MMDSMYLEVFNHQFSAIAEEMGVILRRSSYSPNIKERRDYSCAVFDSSGDMIAQAAHIPVHLGSMPLSVQAAIERYTSLKEPNTDRNLRPGDVIILNDPFRGGTHLPDITLVSPIFIPETSRDDEINSNVRYSPIAFVANRAHHADVGGLAAGSMTIAREIYQEGLIIPPVLLVEEDVLNQSVMDMILANVRTPGERVGDLWAQIAANRRGVERFLEMVRKYGAEEVKRQMANLTAYTERMTRALIASLPSGIYSFKDFLDDDGIDDHPVPIQVTVTIEGSESIVDFTGSAPQQKGSVNAVYAITVSAVIYVFRCLLAANIPINSGSLKPVQIIAPPGSVVNAQPPAPVAAGNVETSQRIVDVLLGALAQAYPDRIPAASQGTMNNVSIGGFSEENQPYTYYETVGGGMGARPWADGPSAVHSHMTNTLNTPVEALEYAYPLRVECYQVRRGSGGKGRYRGGDGIRRDVLLLTNAQVSLLTERRRSHPYGLAGGSPGMAGENILIRRGKEEFLPGKGTLYLQKGDVLSIRAPGGGGYGKAANDER